jgi:hypothetical protein
MKPPTVVVAGALAQQPQLGGHAWVFLQYLLGFRRLGYDVVFLDRLDRDTYTDANVEALQRLLDRFGFGSSFSVLCDGGRRTVGLQRDEVVSRVRESVLLLDVMGYLGDEEILDAAPLSAFLDIDPGFAQIWFDLGLADVLAGHDVFVTIGENIGRDICSIPTCGREWIATRQPVVLDEWPAHAPNGGAFTSIGVWRGPYGPLEHNGRSYGLRVHEFRKFAALPRLCGQPFEGALAIHPDDAADIELLAANGWHLVDPGQVTGDVDAYRTFVQNARAEFMVAKGIYVDTRSGWFSDRSICFLASGRPALVQDTGIDELYPTGWGLVSFSTLDGALDGVERITRDQRAHASAARALAREFFDSDRVLRTLLERVGAR